MSKSRRSGKADGHKAPATPATTMLDAAGIAYEPHAYEHDPRVTDYGAEAASTLGIDAEHVFKTLVLHLDSGYGVCVLPVSHQADLKAAAAALGAKKAALAQAADVSRLTGYVLGGVSPLGTRTQLPVVVDASAENLERVYVSGGRRGFDVSLSPSDLADVLGASFAPVARR